MSPNTNKNNDDKNIIDKAVGATMTGIDATRGFIHDVTKIPEEKQADKSLQEQAQDKLPEQAKVGENVDEAKNILDKTVEAVGNGLNQTRDFIHNNTKSEKEKEVGEKNLLEKMKDNSPQNAADAGTMVGQKLDEGIKAAGDAAANVQKKVDDSNSK